MFSRSKGLLPFKGSCSQNLGKVRTSVPEMGDITPSTCSSACEKSSLRTVEEQIEWGLRIIVLEFYSKAL